MIWIKGIVFGLKWLTGGDSPFKNYGLILLGITIAIGGAWGFHKYAVGSAVHKAVVEYVAASELAAQKALTDEANRRVRVTMKENEDLAKSLIEARDAEAELDAEFAEYLAAQKLLEKDAQDAEQKPDGGVVGATLLPLLHNR